MTMLDESSLRTLFRTRLKTVSGLPGEDYLAWENHQFDKPSAESDQLWIEEFVTILSEPKSSTGFIEVVGVTQYLVNCPKGGGTKDADDLSRLIAQAFEPGQSLTNSTLTVIIERTERSPYRPQPDGSAWVFKTITIRWRVFTPVTSP